MERLTEEKYRTFLESYVSIYDKNSEDDQNDNIEEFLQIIDELIEEGCDLSSYNYQDLYEYYLDENKLKAAYELIKAGIRSGLKMPAGAPIRKTIAKGAVKGGAEVASKVSGDIAKGAGNVVKGVYTGVKGVATKHPVKTAAVTGLAAYDLSKGDKSLTRKGADLAGKGLGAAERAVYGGGTTQTAKPKPTPSKPSNNERNPFGLNQDVDIFDLVKGHLLDEGYADTEDAALVIMANMSEEWRQSIVEQMTGGSTDSPSDENKSFTGEGPKKPKGWKPTGPKLKSGQRPGYAR